ncbi:MAG: hypothetical protein QNJ37_06160 [Crocosphaera sp.]|nr:hypothetical protein [Crocosphaera sp.]
MSNNSQNPKVTIIGAVLSLISALGVALFTNWDKIFPQQNSSEINVSENISPKPQQDTVEVEFVVYTQENYEPLESVKVRFISDGPPSTKYTDRNGYVNITIPIRTDVEVILSKDGFKPAREILNLTTDPDRTVPLFLDKLNNSSNPTPSPSILSSPETSTVGVAIVFDPPSNVRKTPNGDILCSVRERTKINIYSSHGNWQKTDICGSIGFIHSSQITFQSN